ncbi:MAG: sodium:proton antiporter [Deltaproteobacteria bacterium]|nr:sodium:proton antiporter [Deltaproteobacteria bacterium]TLN04309.1 MAG: Na+/H+ antiporter NhaA [bacterium]
MQKIMNLISEFSVPLIGGVIVALFWVNLSPADYYAFVDKPFAETHAFSHLSLRFVTNEIFMVFFFALATVEITQACLPGGDLNPAGKLVNPLLATLGGILGPVVIYLGLNNFFGSPELTRGWVIPVATDIILAWLAARVIFGQNHPAVPFLLLIAFADDAIGLVAISVLYPDPSAPQSSYWLLLTVAGMIAAWLMRKRKILSYWPYLIIGGGLSWIGLFKSHFHPALALVFIVPFFPQPQHEKQTIFTADVTDRSTLTQFELEWKNIVNFGLFLFGLANAGMALSEIGNATWLVLASLVAGKTGGIFALGYLGTKLGFTLPEKVGKKELFLVGMIASIGLSVALLAADTVFNDISLEGSAKMGALLSGSIVLFAIVAGRVLKIAKIP